MTPYEVDLLLKPLNIKEFRTQLRARGLSPAGGIDQLRDRLKEAMIETKDFALKNDDGSDAVTVCVTAGSSTSAIVDGALKNNFTRPEGQNVGNFMTDRNSSRVLAPPGGGSQIVFGDNTNFAGATNAPKEKVVVASCGSIGQAGKGVGGNNYSRPAGQNVGNFMTERSSSRVLAPPGGQSQITFG